MIVSENGVSTCNSHSLRITKQVRKQLCQCLDPATTKGNDWRMLARALAVDRYVNFFATKASPTDYILNLWEARNRQSNAVTELTRIFQEMDRMDAVAILNGSGRPNWL